MSIDRWILFAISNYKRAVEALVPCNAMWAHVTLYYASFFSANAILGMFGVWVSANPERLVDVDSGVAGAQALRVSRRARAGRGTHKAFWGSFYQAAPSISPWVPGHLASALDPVNHDPLWMINERNAVNYDSCAAFDSALALANGFDVRHLRSLRGSLGQQMESSEAILRLTCWCASECGLNTPAFSGLGIGPRASVMRNLIRKTAPSLVNQSAVGDLLS